MKLVKILLKSILRRFGYDVYLIDKRPIRVIYQSFFRGHCFYCIKGDPLTESILTGNGWDNQLSEILRDCFNGKKAKIVEVGANIGASFVTIANEFPNLNFDCYEPVPDFFILLNKNVTSFNATNVHSFNQIFGDQPDKIVRLNVGLGTAGASELSHYQSDGGSIEMAACTLDKVYKDIPFHFLKLDVDGHEYSVLKGGRKVISQYRPYIFMEYSYKILDSMGMNGKELLGLIKELGYSKAKVWDSSGRFISTINQLDEIDIISRECPHYADILFIP